MNDHEAQRIAASMHALRPDWPTASILTLIRKNLIDRPRRDVTVALSWVACEANSHTPARVLETGPWWKAAGIESGTFQRDTTDRTERCSVCSMPQNACRMRWAHDHEFESMVTAAQRRSSRTPDTVHAAVAAIRDGIEPTKEPKPVKTLDELAEENPKLHAKVEAVRANMPKPAPLQEPEPPTKEDESA